MSSSMSSAPHPIQEFYSPRGTFRIARKLTPMHAHDVGHKGEISFDDEFAYVCVRDNLWGRVALDMAWKDAPDFGPLPIAIPPTSELGGKQAPPPPPMLRPAFVMLCQALILLARRSFAWIASLSGLPLLRKG